ncbi:uncharacterized protein EI97DRAFT_377961 [Westerdykella ornata]|uniref:non-specific serine/threonine protein kinase n=1 Tax=Westerdykella ornata TaxID=318751 RepID=A0A6A6JKS8_WESOR|nr:uncharacterized protein EI97DRAFT_377961 [Westerdykella ornata]KAF2276296.1 hypothetical protein EI97DRAFT_377961 [Westerdykella ornata]
MEVGESKAREGGTATGVESVGVEVFKLPVRPAPRPDSEKPPTDTVQVINHDKDGVRGALPPTTPHPEPHTRSGEQKKKTISLEPTHDIYTHYAIPLLTLSSQHRILPFADWANRLDAFATVEKIAEASFSEVYRLRARAALPSRHANESVLKVVALRTPPNAPLPSEHYHDYHLTRQLKTKADMKKQLAKERAKRQQDDEWKSHVDDVHGEVRLLQNLNHIPGFTQFREVTVLQGRPSESFVRAWREWNKPRPKEKKSQFPDPGRKTSYEDTQLWAVIEMQDAGTDCGNVIEAGGIRSIWEVWDVFWGVCLSVAKAEEACRFEHRDLHMDNICVRVKGKEGSESVTEVGVRNPLKRKLGFTELETTVIDYTLSRADIIVGVGAGGGTLGSAASSPASSCADSSRLSDSDDAMTRQVEVAYLDLNKDPSLFEGDAQEEYQYEIYRYMWGIVFHNDPLRQDPAVDEGDDEVTGKRESQSQTRTQRQDYGPETPRKHGPVPQTPQRGNHTRRPPVKELWKHFHPKTNLIWTHFILHSLLRHLSSHGNEPSTLTPSSIMRGIQGVHLDPRSPEVYAAVSEKIYKKAVTLHRILVKVAGLLEPSALGRRSKLGSVRDLVVVALEMGWLGVRDVEGR